MPGGLPEPPGRVLGLMGLRGKERGAARVGRAPPPPLVRIGLGEGGRHPPFLLPLPLPFPLLIGVGKRGVLLLLGGGLLLLARHRGPAGLPPCSFIYGGRGHLETHKLIIDPLAVCGAPSTIIHLGHIIAVVRRSPTRIISPTPSSRRRADGTHRLLRASTGSRVRGMSSS